MTFTIPDRLTIDKERFQQEILIELAAQLYREEVLTLGRCAKLANMGRLEFQKELAKRSIPIHYDVAGLEADFQTAQQHVRGHH